MGARVPEVARVRVPMSQYPVTQGSDGVDPPTVADLTESDTPELIEVYARAWARKVDTSPLLWVNVLCKQRAADLFDEAKHRRERARASLDQVIGASSETLDRWAGMVGVMRSIGETDDELRAKVLALINPTALTTSLTVPVPAVEIITVDIGLYPEAGEDEPTVETEKPRPATICYVCAGTFQPGAMRVVLESGATVCKLCHTLF